MSIRRIHRPTTHSAPTRGRAATLALAAVASLGVLAAGCSGPLRQNQAAATEKPLAAPASARVQTAIFAGGCFWCVESAFDDLPGVIQATSGYTGGPEAHPTYAQVSERRTGHLEAVRVVFDPARISYADLLEVFWRQIDPTDAGGQFADRGPQYRTAIFATDQEQRRLATLSKKRLAASKLFPGAIVTEIRDAVAFWPAESEHQDYHRTHPEAYRSYRVGSGREAFLARTWKTFSIKLLPAAARRPWTRFTKPTPEALRDRLTPEQLRVTQENGTERPFQNAYWDHHGTGIYVDVVSGEPLFSSRDKFKSGTGWPSFTRALTPDTMVERVDRAHGMTRVELRSRYGDSHLGHRFDDGPKPTGQRYCINSAALRFVPEDDMAAQGYGEFLDQVR